MQPFRRLSNPLQHCRTQHVLIARRGVYAASGALLVLLLLLAFPFVTAARSSAGVSAAPAQQNDRSIPVFALPGRLTAAPNQPFDTYLVINDGREFGLVGQTPAIEAQIIQYREMGPEQQVKVWGTLYPDGRMDSVPEIVVSSITLDGAGTPTPTPTPMPAAPYIIVTSYGLNVRSGPDVGYPRVGVLAQGDSCLITGRNARTTWWRVRCPDGLTGWLSGYFVVTHGDTSDVPVIDVPRPPIPTPTPPPQPPTSYTNWRAAFYTNRNLSGSPALVQDVPAVDFNWGSGSPAPTIPPDNFSLRLERTMSFPTGVYEFSVTVDDGVRVYIDNQLIIDSWIEHSARRLTAQRLLSGSHLLRIEYFEAYGVAQLQFNYDVVRTSSDWQVSYYNNPDLRGNPVLTRSEPRGNYPIDQNWGSSSPAPGVVNADNWSGHWVGPFTFEGGDYVFTATVDDGVRVYIDGILVIDAWYDGYKQVSNTFYGIGRGQHEIRVEYYERFGGAALRVRWYRTNTTDEGGGWGRPRDE